MFWSGFCSAYIFSTVKFYGMPTVWWYCRYDDFYSCIQCDDLIIFTDVAQLTLSKIIVINFMIQIWLSLGGTGLIYKYQKCVF